MKKIIMRQTVEFIVQLMHQGDEAALKRVSELQQEITGETEKYFTLK